MNWQILISIMALIVSGTSVWFHWHLHNKSRLPYLVINKKDVEGKISKKYHSSWIENKFYLEYFSDVFMDLVNIGSTHSVVERYYFVFDNALNVKNYVDEAVHVFDFQDKLKVTNLHFDGKRIINFSIDIVGNDGQSIYYQKDIGTNSDLGSVINSNERIGIKLPIYFFIISSYMFMNCKFDDELFSNLPKLKLFVESRDMENKLHVNTFSVSWGGSKYLANNNGFKDFKGTIVARKL